MNMHTHLRHVSTIIAIACVGRASSLVHSDYASQREFAVSGTNFRNFTPQSAFRRENSGSQAPMNLSVQAVSADDGEIPGVTTSTGRATSYYLLWSPGFVTKSGLMVAGLLGLHLSGVSAFIGSSLSRRWHAHLSGLLQGILSASLPNIIMPLLSSSCCLVQLMINVMVGAGGCAGFNTLLGPIRPVFLSLLGYLNLVSRPTVGQGLIRLTLALLPELLYFWNQWRAANFRRQREREIAPSMENQAMKATIEVEIPTMGCVACINKIETSLRQMKTSGRIVDVTSWLDAEKTKGGRARVTYSADSKKELESLNHSILKAIDGAGFPEPKVLDVQFQDLDKKANQSPTED